MGARAKRDIWILSYKGASYAGRLFSRQGKSLASTLCLVIAFWGLLPLAVGLDVL
jgi:hypothetical protein